MMSESEWKWILPKNVEVITETKHSISRRYNLVKKHARAVWHSYGKMGRGLYSMLEKLYYNPLLRYKMYPQNSTFIDLGLFDGIFKYEVDLLNGKGDTGDSDDDSYSDHVTADDNIPSIQRKQKHSWRS